MKALNAVPALFTSYAYYNTDKFVFYGEDLMKRSMAFRSLLDAGIHAAAGEWIERKSRKRASLNAADVRFRDFLSIHPARSAGHPAPLRPLLLRGSLR